MSLSEGGNLLSWLDSILKLPSLADAESLVAVLPPDVHGLTVLPFIAGERSLGWHLIDHEIVARVTRELGIPEQKVEVQDEYTKGFIYTIVRFPTVVEE